VTALYLLLGFLLVGALYWVLIRITARQRQLQADLARLEELSAEVTLHAEGIFDQVDGRLARLTAVMGALEAKAAAAAQPVVAAGPVEPAAAAPAPAKRRGRPKKAAHPEAAAQPTPAPVPAEPVQPQPEVTSVARYQALRPQVWALADQGRPVDAIAHELGLPRGEVQLLLNLRTRQITA
jgi:uncharacterized protein YciI